jgi:hypothetical protein
MVPSHIIQRTVQPAMSAFTEGVSVALLVVGSKQSNKSTFIQGDGSGENGLVPLVRRSLLLTNTLSVALDTNYSI